jgi:hypothetical protein
MDYVGQTKAMMILDIHHGIKLIHQHSPLKRNVNISSGVLGPKVSSLIVHAIITIVHK